MNSSLKQIFSFGIIEKGFERGVAHTRAIVPHVRFIFTFFGILTELERESILEHQRKGIEIAMAEGSTKDVSLRQSMKPRSVLSAPACAGEITATVAMQEVGLKSNTIYRRVKALKL